MRRTMKKERTTMEGGAIMLGLKVFLISKKK